MSGRDIICERFSSLLRTIMDCSVIEGNRKERYNGFNPAQGVDIVSNGNNHHVDMT